MEKGHDVQPVLADAVPSVEPLAAVVVVIARLVVVAAGGSGVGTLVALRVGWSLCCALVYLCEAWSDTRRSSKFMAKMVPRRTKG